MGAALLQVILPAGFKSLEDVTPIKELKKM